MDIEQLIKRVKKALLKKSLREVAKDCSVSHELIRKLSLSHKSANLTADKYASIDKGLRSHGY